MESLRNSGSRILAGAVVAAFFLLVAPGAAVGTRAPERLLPATGEEAASMAVAVAPGPLAISVEDGPLVLERLPGRGNSTRYRGTLPAVRVIDARGSLAGWQVVVRLIAPETPEASGARLFFQPGGPDAVSGQARGVRASRPVWSALGDSLSLFHAEPGYGNGAFDDDASVELFLPYATSVASIAVSFETSVL